MLLFSRPAIAAASAALVLLLAACSGGAPATDDADTDTPVAPVESTPAGGAWSGWGGMFFIHPW